MRKNVFVFVVCGGDVHINTLNYSIRHLKHFSKNEILVVTDTSRNTLEIAHDRIIDTVTPTKLSNHQASIYLKVRLHKIVDLTHQYCYLDSDVIAVDEGVDEVFKQVGGTITFASDHCSLRQFSPNAVTCTCIEERERNIGTLEQLESSYVELERQFYTDLQTFNDQYIPSDKEAFENYKKLKHIIQEYSEEFQWFLKAPPLLQFILARLKPGKYNFEVFLKSKGDYRWNDKTKQAFDASGNLLYDAQADPPQHPSYYLHIKSNSSFVWSDSNTFWLNQKGEDLYAVANCVHLEEQLEKTFGVAIDPKWQHWNGGVFLFNESSVPFMDRWYENTMAVFEDVGWKTRDQGSLIATVWQLNMQDSSRIPAQFNLLADGQNKELRCHPNKGISLNGGDSYIDPKLIHVYHDFGKKGWEVWDYVERKGNFGLVQDQIQEEQLLKNSNNVINGLWIGTELSSIELLTITSFLNNGHAFHLWVYDEISTPLPKSVKLKDATKIIPRDRVFCYNKTNQFGHGKGSFAGFSDIFRYKLLYEKGGWWVDMDVCCLKPFEFESEYVFRKHHQLPAVGNMMKCPKGSEIMKACYEEAIETVTETNTDWHKPIAILTSNIERFKLTNFVRRISNEDKWSNIIPLLSTGYLTIPDWHAIHWANENWRARNMDRTEFVRNSAISRLLNEHGIEHTVTDKPVNAKRRLTFSSLFGKMRELASAFNL
ncbi:MAG: hypothetical protein JKX74_05265 [Flavobacteriales bacterium]|nr:hypothetical protein [Flavobacteriales bacterium]